jgi:hypothetical protein
MKKIVEELKNLITFKETTNAGDIVMIAAKEPKMLFYAYVNNIERDASRKDEWWHVHLTLLSVPLQNITWTLRTEQMNGEEIFTMGGEERFLKAVELGKIPEDPFAGRVKKVSALKRVK